MEMTWLNGFTPNRFGMDKATENVRSEYERDYDRIIFSSAFRRLQNKTQVFPLPEHVFVHNRLTHSLEVVSVGRSLGQMVGDALAEYPDIKANEAAHDFYRNQLKNVISTACLAHDLGNPAFGHSGEEAISQHFRDRAGDKAFCSLFTQAEWEDLTHFEGNANALRILTRQFNGRLKGGYRLTYPTLASILKYPCESTGRIKKGPKHRSKYGFFQSDRETFLDIADTLHLKRESDEPLAYFRHPFVYLVEAADDICYSIIDYEDAHRLGILSFEEVTGSFKNLLEKNPQENMERVLSNLDNLKNDPNEAVAYLRAKAINFLVTECAQVFIDQQEAILKGTFSGALVDHCKSVQEPLKHIEEVSVARIYNHTSVVKIELAGFKIMSGLIKDLVEAALAEEREKRHKKLLNLMPVQYRFQEEDSAYEKIMCILDYVSGMTDNYALELYRNLRGISVPEI
ncbi:MAG: dNTP triphosphohydrolase [Owenweeksia sp.]